MNSNFWRRLARQDDILFYMNTPLVPTGSKRSLQAPSIRALIDQSEELVFIIDPETATIVEASEATFRIAGIARKHIIGQSARKLRISYPLQSDAQWFEFLAAAAAPGGFEMELELGQKYGGTYPALMHVAMVVFEGSSYVVATGYRRSRTEILDAAAARRNARQSALLEMATHPSATSGTVVEGMETITRLAAEAMPSSSCVYWCRVDDCTLEAQTVWGLPTLPVGTKISLDRMQEKMTEIHPGRAADMFKIPVEKWRAAVVEFHAISGVLACVDAPIRHSGVVNGVISFCNFQRYLWDSEDIAFAAAVADQCSTMILNTEHRLSQKAIQESEQRYRNFVLKYYRLRLPMYKLHYLKVPGYHNYCLLIAYPDHQSHPIAHYAFLRNNRPHSIKFLLMFRLS